MSVDALMTIAFDKPRAPRSEEYKNGVRAALEQRIHNMPLKCPYAMGTTAADAYFAGTLEGRDVWCDAQISAAPL